MVIVTGAVTLPPDRLAEALALSLEHVVRSRAEPGCLSHSVHQDVEDFNRLVFVERWADRGALIAHFGVPESRAFVRALAGLSIEPPEMRLYDAEEFSP